jgi:hypothetical protein
MAGHHKDTKTQRRSKKQLRVLRVFVVKEIEGVSMNNVKVTTVSAVATSATVVQAVIPECQKSTAVNRVRGQRS